MDLMGIIKDGLPTLAGLMVFSKYPQYSGTFVKTKIDKFLNVSGNSPCGIE